VTLSWTEFLGVVFGLLCVWLTAKQNIWCWPTGIINNIFFGILLFQSRLYSDFALQVIYAVLSIYGWYEWLYGGKNRTPLPVSRASRKQWVVLALLALTSLTLLTVFLDTSTDTDVPFWDALPTILSLAAQYMLTIKLLENWPIWVVVNLIYIPLYIYKGLYLMSALQILFIIISVMGFIAWRKELIAREQASSLAVSSPLMPDTSS